jgi:hypothetical protein
MNDTPETPQQASNNFVKNRTLHKIWMVLIPFFLLIIIWRLYNWSNGQENFVGVLPPLGMIFVGMGTLIRPRNRNLSFLFTGIAMVLVITALILMFVY